MASAIHSRLPLLAQLLSVGDTIATGREITSFYPPRTQGGGTTKVGLSRRVAREIVLSINVRRAVPFGQGVIIAHRFIGVALFAKLAEGFPSAAFKP